MNHNTASPDLDKVLDYMEGADIHKKRYAFPSRYYIFPVTDWPLIDDLMVPIYKVGETYLYFQRRYLKGLDMKGYQDITDLVQHELDLICYDEIVDNVSLKMFMKHSKQDKYLTAISLRDLDYLKTKLGIDTLKRILQ